jgi:hypothetical protein
MAKKKQEIQNETSDNAASLAVKYLISPDKDKLVEVSYLPNGLVHSLTMLQAYEEQLYNIVEEIRAKQKWYLTRQARRLHKDRQWVMQEYRKIVENDRVSVKDLFINRFRYAFYQASRGRDGKFVESLAILADTDMQTRQNQDNDMYKEFRRQ